MPLSRLTRKKVHNRMYKTTYKTTYKTAYKTANKTANKIANKKTQKFNRRKGGGILNFFKRLRGTPKGNPPEGNPPEGNPPVPRQRFRNRIKSKFKTIRNKFRRIPRHVVPYTNQPIVESKKAPKCSGFKGISCLVGKEFDNVPLKNDGTESSEQFRNKIINFLYYKLYAKDQAHLVYGKNRKVNGPSMDEYKKDEKIKFKNYLCKSCDNIKNKMYILSNEVKEKI